MFKTLNIIRSIFYVLISVFLILLFLNINLDSYYSSMVHSLSRTHIFFVHCFFGFLPLTSLLLFFNEGRSNSWRFKRAKTYLVLLVQFFIVLGLLMYLIEKYPNKFILNHSIGALFTLSLYQLSELIQNTKGVFFQRMTHLLCILSVIVTGHFGVLIYRGVTPLW